MMTHDNKPCICAPVTVCPNKDCSGLVISAELPGVNKEDISLNVSKDHFCVTAERADLRYDCCYELPTEVIAKKSDAAFNNGMLTVKVPFKENTLGEKIAIH